MRLLLVAFFTAVIVVLAPGSAGAAAWPTCGVPQAKAFYETPEIQVRIRQGRMLACHRGSGEVTRVGSWRWGGTDSYAQTFILRSWDGWLWTFDDTSDAASPKTQMALTAVGSGRRLEVRTFSEYPPSFEVAAVPGALVVTGEDGVLALRSDGRIQALSSAQDATRPAAVGRRAYWRTADGTAHTAKLNVDPVSVSKPAPRARTIGRCAPRAGARLLLHHDKVVVTRVGEATYACASGRTRLLAAGPVDDVYLTGPSTVAYTREGSAGTLDVGTGARDERPLPGREPASASVLAFGQWMSSSGAKRVLSPYTGPTYWLDAAGAVHTAG